MQKLKRYGIKGLPKRLHVADSRMDVDDSFSCNVVKYLSPQQIFVAEGFACILGIKVHHGGYSSGGVVACHHMSGILLQHGRHFF